MGATTKKKSTSAAEEAGETRSFGCIYLTVFLDFFANGVVLPLLQGHARGLGASGFNVGMVFTAYSLASIVGSFVFGRASDIWGRRPVILVSLLMSTITIYFTGVAPDLETLIWIRAIAGFFSETSVAQAYIADKTSKEERPRFLGHMGAFIGLGFMVGPATGALLSGYGGFATAAKFTTFVTFLNFIYAVRSLDESLGARKNDDDEEEGGATWGDFFSCILRPGILFLMLGQFATTFAFMAWDTSFGNWAAKVLEYQQKETGLSFTWLAFCMILAMWRMRALIKNNPANLRKWGVVGNVFMAAALAAHQYIDSTNKALPALFLLGFGYGLADIVYHSMISLSTSSRLQGSMLGALQSSQALARAAAPVCVGYLFDQDFDRAYTIVSVFPIAAALLAIVAFSLLNVSSIAAKAKQKTN